MKQAECHDSTVAEHAPGPLFAQRRRIALVAARGTLPRTEAAPLAETCPRARGFGASGKEIGRKHGNLAQPRALN